MTETKLHLGCDDRELSGYVHVDLADYPHIGYQHDIRSLPMFDDESVALIYASHVLEYFDRKEVGDVLSEWHRVLESGGTLRLAVPDFAKLVEVYQEYDDLDRVHGPLYGRWEVPGSDEVLYHHTVYDFDALQTVLTNNGFTDVRRWDWREVFTGENEGYDDYSQAYIPHMDKENGTLISLNVEATKK
jgi:predicted SAM-dependent methyltransferase